ncbi:hypothetical protein [Cupriavidus basilensis]|uniref:Uncharacterized protein n=1 Tax=Cupriavidus basilensis TaxID=68895 RepID=A0A0C4YK08_9BURK|nr:hypothetical protein [Cupriavidus basilensis]AJG22925.1 hypothetical protein RR42_s1337 [Cupriavidus basilensis]
MSTIDPASSTGGQFAAATALAGAAGLATASQATPAGQPSSGKPSDGIHVDLSPAGRTLAASKPASGRNSDIDNSNLPDTAKNLLKRIRELREELARKQQELQAVASAQNLTADQKQVRLAALNQAMSSLSGAIASTTAALAKSMEKASPEQQMSAAALAMG